MTKIAASCSQRHRSADGYRSVAMGKAAGNPAQTAVQAIALITGALTGSFGSRDHNRMSVPLFVNKPGICPYGHSLSLGMPQKVSWLPCMCGPAREAGEQGRGLGHMTVRCGTCSAEDHRDTTYYEPPHQVGHNRPLSGWVTRPDALALRKPRRGRRPQPRAGPPPSGVDP